MATGVLPLLIGEATKLSQYMVEHDKEYEVVLQLGIKTDSADSEGTVMETKPVPSEALQKETVEAVLQTFLGKQKQKPPMYSAIKVKGKKLYEYARQGKQVVVPEREIEILQIKLEEIKQKEQTISFWVHCSKGTYIRSLCEDIATKLQTARLYEGT
ncbi:MAG: tRNA pseudouridine(55) synthase TruB [Clostridia bacterium]|nr:tRNA pseudouridine(55) synthase TruB [Clostridia bacterium]